MSSRLIFSIDIDVIGTEGYHPASSRDAAKRFAGRGTSTQSCHFFPADCRRRVMRTKMRMIFGVTFVGQQMSFRFVCSQSAVHAKFQSANKHDLIMC